MILADFPNLLFVFCFFLDKSEYTYLQLSKTCLATVTYLCDLILIFISHKTNLNKTLAATSVDSTNLHSLFCFLLHKEKYTQRYYMNICVTAITDLCYLIAILINHNSHLN